MNKTVNINLGGMFFYIDEDAYQKLTRYFDAIKRSLSNSNGQDEIIKDIEMRIAELITEKHSNDKQVINIKELDEVIAVMGQPEDYRIDNDGEEPTSNFNSPKGVTKKLYRDRDGGMIGGVLAGLGHFLGIDKVWLRIFLLAAIFFYGTGLLAYIILWIVMPEAVTTTEKLEMQGEPITISNIEKKVREEFENVSEKIKNVDYDKMGNQVKNSAEKIGGSFGDFILTILKIFAKFLGVLLIISALPVLVILLIGVFTLGSSAFFIQFPWQDFVNSGNFTDYPIWFFGLLMFFAVGIPFFFLMLLGFKLLITNMKSIGNVAKYSLLAIWLISVALVISIGINYASSFAVDGRVVKKENIYLKPTDTLHIKFKHNEYFAKSVNERNDFMITDDSLGNKIIYSNQVNIRIQATDEKLPYIQIEKEAKGSSLSEAKKTAEKIIYGYQIVRDQLILDNYLITDFKNKYRDQEVEITLYLPKGVLFKADSSVQDYDYSDDEYFNLHYSSDNYVYKVGEDQVKCLNCPKEENEHNDLEENEIPKDTTITTTTSVNVNGQEVIIKETSKTKGLSTDKNGVIIKNK